MQRGAATVNARLKLAMREIRTFFQVRMYVASRESNGPMLQQRLERLQFSHLDKVAGDRGSFSQSLLIKHDCLLD